jgi:hypothetical protein
MIGMWFSFGPDTECLRESVSAFRLQYPQGVVCICDDFKKPITSEARNAITPDCYEMRVWDNGGNLNGWSAVRGILDFQISMHEKFQGHEGALKIDCDTLIMDSSWINLHAPICGIDIGTTTMFAGMCRYLRNDAPDALLKFIDSKYTWNGARIPEDQVIGNYAALIYGKECECHDWHKVAMSYSYKNESQNQRKAKVITFGNRSEITCGTPCDKRAIAGMHMAKYRAKYNTLEK